MINVKAGIRYFPVFYCRKTFCKHWPLGEVCSNNVQKPPASIKTFLSVKLPENVKLSHIAFRQCKHHEYINIGTIVFVY